MCTISGRNKASELPLACPSAPGSTTCRAGSAIEGHSSCQLASLPWLFDVTQTHVSNNQSNGSSRQHNTRGANSLYMLRHAEPGFLPWMWCCITLLQVPTW